MSTDIRLSDHLAFWSSWSHTMPSIREDVGSSPAPGDPSHYSSVGSRRLIREHQWATRSHESHPHKITRALTAAAENMEEVLSRLDVATLTCPPRESVWACVVGIG